MKFFVAFAALVAVASAIPLLNPVPTTIAEELHAIVAAIHDPNTEPATVGLLQNLLAHIISNLPSPVAVGPAIVEQSPVSVGPALIDFPLPEGAIPEPVPAQPSPVVVGPIPPGAPTPLVQIIVNVKSPAEPVQPVSPVADNAADPVNVVDHPEVPATPITADPVTVVENTPVVEPVIVATPVLPHPAVILPEELN